MRTNVEVVLVRRYMFAACHVGSIEGLFWHNLFQCVKVRVSSMFGGCVSNRALQRSFGRTSELATKA